MRPLDWILAAVALLGAASSARWYMELRRWARMCQRARIAIAYKRRVQGQWPLVEWLGWCFQLQGDEKSSGRMVYSRAGVSVSILKPARDLGPARRAIARVRRRKHNKAPAKPGALEVVK